MREHKPGSSPRSRPVLLASSWVWLLIQEATGGRENPTPLERMVFVGDSDADRKSAVQLGLRFLENRYNAMRHNIKSLIRSLDPEGHPFLTGRAGELLSAINDIESKIKQLP
jgi:hypothetical protein